MSSINNQNISQCPLLNLPAIPTFGIFDKDNYLLMEPIHIIKSQKMMPDNLPPKIFQQIKIITQYNQIIPEFYHITLNANKLYINSNERIIESNFTRINLVAHPYIFNNPGISNTTLTHINCAIYKENDELETILETNELNNLAINPENEIISNELNREIALNLNQSENKIYLEPNNCAFLINLNSQIINFNCIVLGTHNKKVIKCFIGNYVIMPNALNSHLLKMSTQNLLNYQNNIDMFLSLIKEQYLYNDSLMGILFYFLDKIMNNKAKYNNINEIKEIFIKAFKIIYDFDTNDINPNDHEQDLYNIGNFYFNHIKNFLNYIYEGSNCIENFSERLLLCNINNQYIIEIIIKYIDFHLSRINNIINSYFDFFIDKNLNNIKIKAAQAHKNVNWPLYQQNYCNKLNINKKDFDKAISYFINKKRKKIENHNIELFQKLCDGLLESQNIDINVLEQIDEPIREYFYYYIWVYKGKLNGIHKDFGKLSFIWSDKIKPIYHCLSDERYGFIEKMISVLKEADSPYSSQK